MNPGEITFINGGKKFEGVTRITLEYKKAFESLGFKTTWRQFIDEIGEPQNYIEDNVTFGTKVPGRFLSMGINRLYTFPRKMRNLDSDVLFVAEPTLAGVGGNAKFRIVHVHDLRPLTKYGDSLSSRLMFKHVLPIIRDFDMILAPSNKVRDELLDINFDEDQIQVVNETTSTKKDETHLQKALKRIENQGRINALYIAQDRPYKNIDFLLKIAELIQRRKYAVNFTLISKLKASTMGLLDKLSLRNVNVVSQVDDISEIYKCADILVNPSTYEGFGIPLIESMAYGIPIVASSIRPFDEILMNSGKLLPLDNINNWVEEITSFFDITHYAKYANRSLKQFDLFSSDVFERRLENIFGRAH